MNMLEKTIPFLDQAESGPRRVSREIFTSPELFELEFPRIWEKVWVYGAHESEIAKPRSFVTRWVGRVPVIINRNKAGEINAFVNVCTHRGATLCRVSKGTRANFVCPFHGWAFDDNGSLIAPMNEQDAGYPDGFEKKALLSRCGHSCKLCSDPKKPGEFHHQGSEDEGHECGRPPECPGWLL